ncbi:hypothetical protein D3C81_1357690 [compost metagenome]
MKGLLYNKTSRRMEAGEEQDEDLSQVIQAVYDKYTFASKHFIEIMNTYVSQNLNEFIELV